MGCGWNPSPPPDMSLVTGVLYQRSRIRIADICDGLTNTYLLGEKYVATPFYQSFGDPGYDQSIVSGDDWDLIRWTADPPAAGRDECARYALRQRAFVGLPHVFLRRFCSGDELFNGQRDPSPARQSEGSSAQRRGLLTTVNNR